MPYIVYKLTCACGKCYIGQTSGSLEIRKTNHFTSKVAGHECLVHWRDCCQLNQDNCYDEILLQNLNTYDESLYNEAKFILDNRNIGQGLLNSCLPGVWTNYLLSCICGMEMVVTTTGDPLTILVIK